MSPTTTRQAEPDQACADAVDLARTAAEADAGPGQVGPHVATEVEGDRIVTHLFACLSPAYVGWRWAVTVARASRSKTVTVNESVLLPGPDSMLAPDWVPWTERVRPGDLKAGDLLPASSDDERLVPVVAIAGDAGLLDWDENEAWRLPDLAADAAAEDGEATAGGRELTDAGAKDDPDVDQPQPGQPQPGQAQPGQPQPGRAQSGQPQAGQAAGTGRADGAQSEARRRGNAGGRSRPRRRPGSRERERTPGMLRPTRVLSATGRDEAAFRWHTGDQGPSSELASAAPANCLTCGFMVRLSGPLGRVFGVCANEFAPDDGKVVSIDHGCGAHSDGAVVAEAAPPDLAAPTVDELGYDMLATGATVPESVLETLDHEQL